MAELEYERVKQLGMAALLERSGTRECCFKAR
jgi:hypothetical protein